MMSFFVSNKSSISIIFLYSAFSAVGHMSLHVFLPILPVYIQMSKIDLWLFGHESLNNTHQQFPRLIFVSKSILLFTFSSSLYKSKGLLFKEKKIGMQIICIGLHFIKVSRKVGATKKVSFQIQKTEGFFVSNRPWACCMYDAYIEKSVLDCLNILNCYVLFG